MFVMLWGGGGGGGQGVGVGGGGAGGGGGDVVDKRCIAVRDARSLVTKRTEGGIKFIGQKRYVTLERPLMNLTNQHKLFRMTIGT